MSPNFDNIFNKVKTVTKKAADGAGKQAKVAKLKMNTMTLQTEKSRHLQTIGARTYSIYLEKHELDGQSLFEQIKEEFDQVERIDRKILEIEEQIAEIQAAHVEVSDVTEEA
jgi:hypothetical protein